MNRFYSLMACLCGALSFIFPSGLRAQQSDLQTFPREKVLLEHGTATWCSYCPRGERALELLEAMRDDYICLAYHNNDVMSQSEAVAFFDLNDFLPFALVDRLTASGSGSLYVNGLTNDLEKNVANQLSAQIDRALERPTFARLSLSISQSGGTSLTVRVNGECTPDYAANVGSDARLVVLLVEDSVTANQYDGEIDQFIEGYVHRHVVRRCLTDFEGQQITWRNGKCSFQRTLTSTTTGWNVFWKLKDMSVVAFIARPLSQGTASDWEILAANACTMKQGKVVAGIDPALSLNQGGEQAVYDLCGRKVAAPRRGIYVVGGRKTYVK